MISTQTQLLVFEDYWRNIIKRASSLGSFDQGEVCESEMWPNCAVGKRLNLGNMPYRKSEEFGQWLKETHPTLYGYGIDFSKAVAEDNTLLADILLTRISGYCEVNPVNVPDKFVL